MKAMLVIVTEALLMLRTASACFVTRDKVVIELERDQQQNSSNNTVLFDTNN